MDSRQTREGPTLDKSELIQAVREGVGGLNWGNETFGAYLGRMQAACQTAAYYATKLLLRLRLSPGRVTRRLIAEGRL